MWKIVSKEWEPANQKKNCSELLLLRKWSIWLDWLLVAIYMQALQNHKIIRNLCIREHISVVFVFFEGRELQLSYLVVSLIWFTGTALSTFPLPWIRKICDILSTSYTHVFKISKREELKDYACLLRKECKTGQKKMVRTQVWDALKG